MVGLGQAEAADDLAGREPRQVFLALLLGAVGVDRMHDQARLHRHRRAVAAIDALHFARDQAVGDVVGAGAAIAVDGGAEQAERAQLVHDLAIELLVPVRLQHPRHQLVLGIAARGVAHHALFLGQLVLEQERVFPVKFGFALGLGVHGRLLIVLWSLAVVCGRRGV